MTTPPGFGPPGFSVNNETTNVAGNAPPGFKTPSVVQESNQGPVSGQGLLNVPEATLDQASSSRNDTKKILSLEELEAQLLKSTIFTDKSMVQANESNQPLTKSQEHEGPLVIVPGPLYSGLMTAGDVQHVQRIRNNQLMNMDARIEDFYYQSFKNSKQDRYETSGDKSSNRNDHVNVDALPFLPLPMTRYSQSNQPFRQPNIVRPSQLKIQGALGQVQFNNIRKPKSSIEIEAKSSQVEGKSDMETDSALLANSRRNQWMEQKWLEDMWYESLEIDNFVGLRDKLINHFGVASLYEKGHKLFSRVCRLTPEISRKCFEKLLVTAPRYSKQFRVIEGWPTQLQAFNAFQESFISNIVTPLLVHIQDCQWPLLLKWFHILLPQSATLNSVLNSKMGHVLLCVLLSLGELLKTKKDNEDSKNKSDIEEHVGLWKAAITSFFTSHQDQFLPLFSLEGDREEENKKVDSGTANSHTPTASSTTVASRSSVDEYYLWQSMAFIAMNLGESECHELVAELRRPILQAATAKENPFAIMNVNLLLHVIGLDASQLSRVTPQ